MMNNKKLKNWENIRTKVFTRTELEHIDQEAEYKIMLRKLQEIRKNKNLTQQQLSEITGVPRATIARIEQGKQNVSIQKLQQIINPMGMKLNIEITERK